MTIIMAITRDNDENLHRDSFDENDPEYKIRQHYMRHESTVDSD